MFNRTTPATGLRASTLEPIYATAPGAARALDEASAVSARVWIVVSSIAAGAILTLLWSFTLVDDTIGFNVANNALGYNATTHPINSSAMGAVFAFVSGLAGSFTACNVAAFSAIAPLSDQRRRIGDSLKPMAWLAAGACAVAALYGAIGALVGTGIPQLSTSMVGGFPVRLIQASVVFTIIGLCLGAFGLMALGVIPNPLKPLYDRHPRAQVFILGGLIGAFLVGRPYPLFFKTFKYAASTHNPLFGAGAFVLQSLGNIVVMALLFLLLTYGAGGRFPRWLAAKPGRAAVFTSSALLVAAAFLITYWGIRVPSHFGVGWWPTMPWS